MALGFDCVGVLVINDPVSTDDVVFVEKNDLAIELPFVALPGLVERFPTNRDAGLRQRFGPGYGQNLLAGIVWDLGLGRI
jgi:hypothetical protein